MEQDVKLPFVFQQDNSTSRWDAARKNKVGKYYRLKYYTHTCTVKCTYVFISTDKTCKTRTKCFKPNQNFNL